MPSYFMPRCAERTQKHINLWAVYDYDMTDCTASMTVVWLSRGMTKIYRTHGSHKVLKAKQKFVGMGHTGHDDRDRSKSGCLRLM